MSNWIPGIEIESARGTRELALLPLLYEIFLSRFWRRGIFAMDFSQSIPEKHWRRSMRPHGLTIT